MSFETLTPNQLGEATLEAVQANDVGRAIQFIYATESFKYVSAFHRGNILLALLEPDFDETEDGVLDMIWMLLEDNEGRQVSAQVLSAAMIKAEENGDAEIYDFLLLAQRERYNIESSQSTLTFNLTPTKARRSPVIEIDFEDIDAFVKSLTDDEESDSIEPENNKSKPVNVTYPSKNYRP